MAMACFVQAAYLLELDRQENRTAGDGLAPKWWKAFKYKLAQALVDARDGSIYGAVLEWDPPAALSQLLLPRPAGAPKAVLALRGTLLKGPTIRRDLEDDLRFLAWESLKGSARFEGALRALTEAVERFGGNNVFVGGHSLGAGFALQVGKALAKRGVFVECHLFNPPSVSVAASVRDIGQRAGLLWARIKDTLPFGASPEATQQVSEKEEEAFGGETKKWMPNLYVNISDYICCRYNDTAGTAVATNVGSERPKMVSGQGGAMAKLFITAKGPRKFLEAHGLEQWWGDEIELQEALHNNRLINMQLRSLYISPAARKS